MTKNLTEPDREPMKKRLASSLESFLNLHSAVEIPIEYKRMAFLQAISACVGRQVWIETSFGRTFPNSYLMYIGSPGTGKSVAIEAAEALLLPLAAKQKLYLSATNLSKASLLDDLAKARRSFRTLSRSADEHYYHHINIFSSEMGTLMGGYNPELLTTLSTLFDNRPIFVERKRSVNSGEPMIIDNPTVSFITGSQPRYYTEHVPMTAWEQGFATRPWYEYVDTEAPRTQSMFAPEVVEDTELRDELIRELECLTQLQGKMELTRSALLFLDDFYLNEDQQTAPTHSILQGYNRRRTLRLQKYIMLYALSERRELRIEESDCQQVLDWMLDSERRLKDMFDVVGASQDSEIARAIYDHVKRRFEEQRIGTTHQQIILYISSRTDVHKVDKFLKQLKEMGAIREDYAMRGGIKDKTRKVFYPMTDFKWN